MRVIPTLAMAAGGVFVAWVHHLRWPPLLRFVGASRDLAGIWTGTIEQPDPPSGCGSASVIVQLQTRGNHLHGVAQVQRDGPLQAPVVALDVIGGRLDGGSVRLEFTSREPSPLRSGSVHLRGDAEGRSLVGRFAGWDAPTQSIVHGAVALGRYLGELPVRADAGR